MNKDTVAGTIKEKGGQVRANVDKLTGDTAGQVKGRQDQAAGKFQKNMGKIEDAID